MAYVIIINRLEIEIIQTNKIEDMRLCAITYIGKT